MKKRILIAFVFLTIIAFAAQAHNEHPLGRQAIPWTPDQNILRTLSYNFDFAGGGDFVTWRPPGGIEKLGEHECLVGPYFFFDVRDEFAFNIDETVTLELLFDATITEGFNLSYDHAVNPSVVTRTFTSRDERWRREIVALPRARFANRKYGKTDFAIGGLKSLFPADNSGGGHNIALCDIKVHLINNDPASLTKSRINIAVHDENGQATSARVGIYDATGRAPLASDEALEVRRFSELIRDIPLRQVPSKWPSDGRFIFYIDGSYESQLQANEYTLVVSKGPEYKLHVQKFRVKNAEPINLDVRLTRWIDMPANGWYSGDDHIHIARQDPSGNHDILSFTGAEDIHLANLLQMANVTTWHFPQYAFGAGGHHSSDTYGLLAGQESPRTSHRGHTIGLNAKSFHWPEKDYFLYDKTANAIRADGGLFGYAHVAIDGFNVEWGLAIDVPLGIVDFLEMLQMGVLNTEYFYDFLNLGYKLLPSAGSDYPYIHIAGAERVYAKLGTNFSVSNWFDAWRNNRSFVSNGPIVEFTVNGDDSATEFSVAQGDSITIQARSALNPDLGKLQKFELVIHGNVVESTLLSSDEDRLVMDYQFRAEESLWLALRTYGENGTVAHTAPIYIFVDGNENFWSKELSEDIALKYLKVLDTLKNSTPNLQEEWERFNVENDVLPKWHHAKSRLDQDIERAAERYRLKIEQAKGESQVLQ